MLGEGEVVACGGSFVWRVSVAGVGSPSGLRGRGAAASRARRGVVVAGRGGTMRYWLGIGGVGRRDWCSIGGGWLIGPRRWWIPGRMVCGWGGSGWVCV